MDKQCHQCNQQFEITDDDLKFYEKVSPVLGGKKYSIPVLNICSECRIQKRMMFINERKLYYRKSDANGKMVVSNYSSDKIHTIYDQEYWFTDNWDPISYGQEFDFNRSFFSQYKQLFEKVPRLNLDSGGKMENSIYNNHVDGLKDCYNCAQTGDSENCINLYIAMRDKNCIDCFVINDSDSLYECVNTEKCYNLLFSVDSYNSSNSIYLKNCRSCSDCIACVNLINKQYCINNKQYSKEEYFIEKEKILEAVKKDYYKHFKLFQNFSLKYPVKFTHSTNTENSTGDYFRNCVNCQHSYFVDDSEGCRYCTQSIGNKDCFHCFSNFGLTLGYECISSGGNSSGISFGVSVWENCSNMIYCDYCMNSCSDCFGCVGLRHKQYCILNKQYTKEEYEKLVPKIIENMQKNPLTPFGEGGMTEWGEFFPIEISPFCYNETVAMDYFPLTKEEVLARGWKWKDEDTTNKYQGVFYQVNEDINFYKDETNAKELLNSILICEVTGKPYKIIPQELAFYLKQGIPIPRRCPDQRFRDRLALRNPRKLFDRKCMKCGLDIKTTYSPERKELVYCEECYQGEVY